MKIKSLALSALLMATASMSNAAFAESIDPDNPPTTEVMASTSSVIKKSGQDGAIPTISTKPDWATSIAVTDSAGRPMRIDSISVGNPSAFDVALGKSHTLVIHPKTTGKTTNLIVKLVDVTLPFTVILEATASKVDALHTIILSN